MELDARQKAKRLLSSLTGYEAQFELMCIGVSSGGTRVAASEDLPGLYREYIALVPAGGARFVDLIVAHREVIRTLCRLREDRLRSAGELGPQSRDLRAKHSAAVFRLGQEVRPLVA
jgi:hypothetical protein